ncbi:MAG: hypothetical protein KGJ95_01645, partial [Candidatus Omnitrophica bacterium]|nr:hypothetical protein [Candidatus Omnitrophota bacterium]
ETAFATNCGVAPASKGQLVSAAYVNSIKACIDTQYASCGVSEPAGLWTLSTGQTFTNEVSQGKIIRAEHIRIMQKAIKTLAVDMASVPGAVHGAISFSPDCTPSPATCKGRIISAADATNIINAVNQFECPLCGAMSLPVNNTTASFPTVGEGTVATGTCAWGSGSATATCGANGNWGPATGTCCAPNWVWYQGACCQTVSTCPFSGYCGANSLTCGLSGTCDCPPGQSCDGTNCVCPIGEVPYNGACCIPSCAGKCTGGSDACGGICTNNCASGEVCDAGICSAISPQFYVAATSCSAGTNTTKVLCYSPASYVIYNNESFTYCSTTPATNPGMLLVSSVAASPGIPAVINGGCSDNLRTYGEPGTGCEAAWPTCQDGIVTYTTNSAAWGNIPYVSAVGTQYTFSCPAGYIVEPGGGSTVTFTCGSGGWTSTPLCSPCTYDACGVCDGTVASCSGACTASNGCGGTYGCSGDSCICNAGSNPDACGVCGGGVASCSGACTASNGCGGTYGCSGDSCVCNAGSSKDACGICGGTPSNPIGTSCVNGSGCGNGTWACSSYGNNDNTYCSGGSGMDVCGICGGTPTNPVGSSCTNSSGCTNGAWACSSYGVNDNTYCSGGSSKDACGVCGGTVSSCAVGTSCGSCGTYSCSGDSCNCSLPTGDNSCCGSTPYNSSTQGCCTAQSCANETPQVYNLSNQSCCNSSSFCGAFSICSGGQTCNNGMCF